MLLSLWNLPYQGSNPGPRQWEHRTLTTGWVHAQWLQPCLTFCDPMECSLPGSSVHGILQARILEWVAMPSCRGSFQPRDWIRVSCVSCTAGGFFTVEPPLGSPPNHWTTREFPRGSTFVSSIQKGGKNTQQELQFDRPREMGLREHPRASQLDTGVACFVQSLGRVQLFATPWTTQELLRKTEWFCVPKSLGQPRRTGHWQPVTQRGRKFQCSGEGPWRKRERNLRSQSSEVQKKWWAWTILQRLITSRIK